MKELLKVVRDSGSTGLFRSVVPSRRMRAGSLDLFKHFNQLNAGVAHALNTH